MTSGAILGVALVIYAIILYMLNLSFNKVLGYGNYLILIGGVFFGIKVFRDQVQKGEITFGQALGVGVLTVVFASVIVAFFTYIQLTFIDSGILAKGMEIAKNQMIDKGLNDEQIEKAMSITQKFMTPLITSIFLIFVYAFWGTIFSLIAAAFMKKEPSINPEQ